MAPHKNESRIGECSIDMSFTCQDDLSASKMTRPFADDNMYPSQSSSLNSYSADICRICHCEGGPDLPLITPCYCAGSLRYVHQTCLIQWIKSSNIRSCELCKFQFIMQTKVKPFNEWEYLEMSGLERKKLLCAMLFHIIAMTCVCWSLYVLIDRTLDEVKKGHLEWPFWTKLIVVGIGFMGGIVFMYIQCRAYFVLCQRWKAYNRVIFVQNAPENSSPQSSKLITCSEHDIGPSCSVKGYPDSKKNVTETKCIDIKGVRNLHIIFGDENQIRLHHDNREKRTPAQNEACGESSCTGLKDKNSHSVHIQIASKSDRARNFTPIKHTFDKSQYGPLKCTSEKMPDLHSKVDKYMNKKDFKNNPSVVKLQIKKAEIVIEFAKNNAANQLKFSNKRVDDHNSRNVNKALVWNGAELGCSPKRRFSSEEYLDLKTKYRDKVANEVNESPTSKLLISDRNIHVPYNNYSRDKTLMKDWKSSEDLLVRESP